MNGLSFKQIRKSESKYFVVTCEIDHYPSFNKKTKYQIILPKYKTIQLKNYGYYVFGFEYDWYHIYFLSAVEYLDNNEYDNNNPIIKSFLKRHFRYENKID